MYRPSRRSCRPLPKAPSCPCGSQPEILLPGYVGELLRAAGVVLDHLAVPDQDVLVNHEPFHSHGAAGVDLVGAYAHLGTLAVTEPVGEPRGRVYENIRGVD